MICATIHGPTLFDAKRQLNYASDYADRAELRMDLWANHRKEEVEKLIHEHPDIPLIFSLKPHPKMTELKRLEEIEKLASLRPGYFEIEHEVPDDIRRSLMRKFSHIQWITTKHFSRWSEEEITAVYEQHVREYPQTYLKVTVDVTDSLEALKLCRWLREKHDEHLLGYATGLQGQISYLLSPIAGNSWTYASADPKHIPKGMFAAETLRYTYRIKKSRPLEAFLLQFTSPVQSDCHYLSHNSVLEQIHEPVIFAGIETKHLEEVWKELKELPFRGAGVGKPYQEEMMLLLDYTDPIALKIGGVNAVVVEGDISYGFNNEGFAVLDTIEKQSPVKGKTLGILGADLTARAIALEGTKRGAKVTVYSPDSKDAKKIAYEIGCGDALWGKWGSNDVWINTLKEEPLPQEVDKIAFKKGQIIADVRLSLEETPLLARARQAGATPLGEDAILVQEGSGQFCLWFRNILAIS
jgi:shikimate 5-dehydrogenase/3-dehydroquinate dehydratase